ncbi:MULTISPECIES: DNA-binding protein [unclassified Pseudomonas]|uniref:DNA-binding protein n=1 Tax=unclassified Pseudomonas TaxID=196821 RepID=UPI000D38F697|nr:MULTISPECIES: DNA-binding protein [unclassified Pseudomonas]RAU47950.1 integrase [Pseudomonas sp. RIT 409]RAU55356.1 integrase [Pseudomonas sp. RIT 412]
MARGGINKAIVQKARQALLAKGVNPTIDAVRVELGNTGSKTTISRYLKELEASSPAVAPVSRERLGDALSGMVQTLLDQLMEEGQETISEATAAFALERTTLETHILELTSALAKVERKSATQHAALEVQSAEIATAQSSLQAELTRNAGLSQRCSDLEALVVEKDKHIQSLEEKHVQARGALEHYREAAKEQRDQDHRKHESQLHEMQVEQRKLRETIAVKQDESTRLNRDNERLLGEARQQAKSLRTQEALIQSLNIQVETSRQGEAKTAGVAEHLNGQLSELREEVKALHKAATVAELQERETAARITSLQNENEQLRHAQGVGPAPKDGSEPPPSARQRKRQILKTT